MVNFSSTGIFKSGIWSPRVSKLSLEPFLPPPNRFLKTPILTLLDRSLGICLWLSPYLFGGFHQFLFFLFKWPLAEDFFQIVLKDNLFFQKALCQLCQFVPVFLQQFDGPLVLFLDYLGDLQVDPLCGLLAIGFGEPVLVLARGIVIGDIAQLFV